MGAQLYNFRGNFQLVDVPDEPARPALPAPRRSRELVPYVAAGEVVRYVGSRARVDAELARLRAAGRLAWASEPVRRPDKRVYVDVQLREYPWAPAVAPAPQPRRRRRPAVIAAAVAGVAAVLLGLAYAVLEALRDVVALLVSFAPALGGLVVAVFLLWLFLGGRGGCGGMHCGGCGG